MQCMSALQLASSDNNNLIHIHDACSKAASVTASCSLDSPACVGPPYFCQ